MTTHQFKQVDAFSSRPLKGNPVAVVFDADGLSDGQMQHIAAWTNLSETTFVLKPTTPDADFRLRIFYPRGELAFAGHPTIGSTHAVLEARRVAPRDGRMVMECAAGNLPLRVEGDGPDRRIFVLAPQAEVIHDFATSIEAIESALGTPIVRDTPPTSIYNGPTWIFVQLASSEHLSGLKPDLSALGRLTGDLGSTGFALFTVRPGDECAVHIRCLAPGAGVAEDPVTGSANAALPTYLARTGLIEKTGRQYIATQGTELGRDGRVYVSFDGERTEIGGEAVTVIDGEINL
jgi:PhzF family phenazine biosynthesis protein